METVTKKSNTEKRKPKGPIKFKVDLNSEQREAKQTIYNNTIVLLRGNAGSGKTFAAVHVALDMFFKREIEKIVITRPVVAAADEIGFLPGDIKQKMDPWLAPIYANLYACYDKEIIDEMVLKNEIEILPFAFVRGRTLVNACVVVDECQNVTQSQTEMIIGRLGKGSKMIFCGDTSQIDLKSKKDSGIDFFKNLELRIEGVKTFTLKENHRHEIVPLVLDIYKEFN